MSSINRRDALRAGMVGLAGAAAAGLSATSSSSAPEMVDQVLAGRVALITGAARGIGRAIALAMAEAGADVACLDICQDIKNHPFPMASSSDLRETIRQVKATGQRAIAIEADVRDYAAMKAAVARTERELGPLDCLIGNAGIDKPTNIIDNADDDAPWRNVMEVNVLGTANTLRAALPGMASRGRGSIVLTASTFGRSGSNVNPNYAASKWAVVGLMKSAALQAGPRGVRINAVAPTGVATGINGPISAAKRQEYDKFFNEQYHPMDVGMLEPEHITGAVVFLASDAARYVTGTTVDVAAGANARYTG